MQVKPKVSVTFLLTSQNEVFWSVSHAKAHCSERGLGFSSFPTDKDKNTLGKVFLLVSVQAINKMRQGIIIGTRVQEKIDLLSQFAEIYGQINNLWTP